MRSGFWIAASVLLACSAAAVGGAVYYLVPSTRSDSAGLTSAGQDFELEAKTWRASRLVTDLCSRAIDTPLGRFSVTLRERDGRSWLLESDELTEGGVWLAPRFSGPTMPAPEVVFELGAGGAHLRYQQLGSGTWATVALDFVEDGERKPLHCPHAQTQWADTRALVRDILSTSRHTGAYRPRGASRPIKGALDAPTETRTALAWALAHEDEETHALVLDWLRAAEDRGVAFTADEPLRSRLAAFLGQPALKELAEQLRTGALPARALDRGSLLGLFSAEELARGALGLLSRRCDGPSALSDEDAAVALQVLRRLTETQPRPESLATHEAQGSLRRIDGCLASEPPAFGEPGFEVRQEARATVAAVLRLLAER